MTNLFVKKDFIMHSGEKGDFKIECDALTDEDIETLAYLIAKKYEISHVVGVPNGGLRLQYALEKYCKYSSGHFLIVDDVLTTGNSMEEKRKSINDSDIVGVVIFDRSNGKCPDWIKPLFTLNF